MMAAFAAGIRAKTAADSDIELHLRGAFEKKAITNPIALKKANPAPRAANDTRNQVTPASSARAIAPAMTLLNWFGLAENIRPFSTFWH